MFENGQPRGTDQIEVVPHLFELSIFPDKNGASHVGRKRQDLKQRRYLLSFKELLTFITTVVWLGQPWRADVCSIAPLLHSFV